VVRTSWVYAPHGKNFFLTIAKRAAAGEPLLVVADQEGVPTESRFLADMTLHLVRHGAEGLFNAVPSGRTTWYGFAEAIVAKLGIKTPVRPVSSCDYPRAARRPPYSVLSNEKLNRAVGPVPSWTSLLDRCIANFKARGQ
jgi:dTDP-4-dehydrorhamnose reductase